ncbi:tail fiber assembly protein [Aeromonas hydrophila]|uniref:tail fiber assembly protein n=1 Tax=Aeromonas hydrophila TaxID=644 RepID=UPI00203F2731|nr:tail fiber assembly protein [Aeromonas hydrophila]
MTEHNNSPRATWGDDGFAETSGLTMAYIADHETAEYRGLNDVWVSAGTGLPAGAYHDAPPAREEGKAIVRQVTGWQLVTDLRGVVVYDKSTGQPVTVNAIGELLDQHTLLEPSSPYDKWTDDGWVKDEAAEQQAKLEEAKAEQSGRIAIANLQIAILKPAVDGGYAKPEHTKLLADWQRCRYELTLVPEQPGWPEKPQWPTEPDKVI